MGSVKQRARAFWAKLGPRRPIRCDRKIAGRRSLNWPAYANPMKTAIETQNAEAKCSRRFELTGCVALIPRRKSAPRAQTLFVTILSALSKFVKPCNARIYEVRDPFGYVVGETPSNLRSYQKPTIDGISHAGESKPSARRKQFLFYH